MTMAAKPDKLESELRVAAKNWRDSQKHIGGILNKLAEKGYPVRLHFGILREEFGMPVATAKCCMRWAAGEFGDDKRAIMLMCKVPHSVLSQWTKEALVSACGDEHRIISPDENRVVAKTIDQMSSREVRKNINTQGFVPVSSMVNREPEFRSCTANTVEFDDDGVPTLVSKGREVIRMRVPRKVLDMITSGAAAVAEA